MAATAALMVFVCAPHGSLAPTYRRPYLGGAHAHGARRAITMSAQNNSSAPANPAAAGQTYEWSVDRDVAPADKLWTFKKAVQRKNFLGIRSRESVADPAGQLRPLVRALVLGALGLALGVSFFFAFSRDLVPQEYVEAVTTATTADR